MAEAIGDDLRVCAGDQQQRQGEAGAGAEGVTCGEVPGAGDAGETGDGGVGAGTADEGIGIAVVGVAGAAGIAVVGVAAVVDAGFASVPGQRASNRTRPSGTLTSPSRDCAA
jgi:hypothetical protein